MIPSNKLEAIYRQPLDWSTSALSRFFDKFPSKAPSNFWGQLHWRTGFLRPVSISTKVTWPTAAKRLASHNRTHLKANRQKQAKMRDSRFVPSASHRIHWSLLALNHPTITTRCWGCWGCWAPRLGRSGPPWRRRPRRGSLRRSGASGVQQRALPRQGWGISCNTWRPSHNGVWPLDRTWNMCR